MLAGNKVDRKENLPEGTPGRARDKAGEVFGVGDRLSFMSHITRPRGTQKNSSLADLPSFLATLSHSST